MEMNRKWAMPNKNTFSIKPIKELIEKYNDKNYLSIDPFANTSKIAKITNDLDTDYNTNYNLDALDFLKLFEDNSVDLVFFDPPYTTRQVSECYKKMNLTVNKETTQSTFWSNIKKEITRIVKKDGLVLTFGYNSNGVGKTNGFEMIELLLVAHGGTHFDTIVTVEKKIK